MMMNRGQWWRRWECKWRAPAGWWLTMMVVNMRTMTCEDPDCWLIHPVALVLLLLRPLATASPLLELLLPLARASNLQPSLSQLRCSTLETRGCLDLQEWWHSGSRMVKKIENCRKLFFVIFPMLKKIENPGNNFEQFSQCWIKLKIQEIIWSNFSKPGGEALPSLSPWL